MKIAIMVNRENFEKYALTDLAWEDWELIHIGNEAPDEDTLIATDADVLLADPMCPVSARVINSMKNLKLIQSQGVGYNMFDLDAARQAGVYVTNCAGANASAVAEQTILLMLALLRKYRENEDMVFAAMQIEAKNRCFKNGLIELGDCHIGIIGMGAIGRAVAARLKAFGSRISYYDPIKVPDCEFDFMSLAELFAQCDIISLHVPVGPETLGMINEAAIGLMKRGAIIINTARGEIVDQAAVSKALIDGQLGGYGADTYSPEPLRPDNPLLLLPPEARKKVSFSPHIGGITEGSFRRYFDIAWKNINRICNNDRPVNIVNGL